MMQRIHVQRTKGKVQDVVDSATAAILLEESPWHVIACSPWSVQFPYKPDVKFRMAHDDEAIILEFDVAEEFVKANYIRINENVWEDSCVEFFLSLDNKESYYNCEFNVLGTGLIGYGTTDKKSRKRFDADIVRRVRTYSWVSSVFGQKTWQLTLCIPKDIFLQDIVPGKVYHANFYKCGDALPHPHYLSWNDIQFEKPNFHLPSFFGQLIFE